MIKNLNQRRVLIPCNGRYTFRKTNDTTVSKSFTVLFLSVFFLNFNSAIAQVQIISSAFSGIIYSPEAICNLNLSIGSKEDNASVEGSIANYQGNLLLTVKSTSFRLKQGIYNTTQLGAKVNNVVFYNSALSEYVKIYGQLPSGKYNYIVKVRMGDGSSDEFVEEFEVENSTYMSLVNPIDQDTINTPYPILIWTHAENFNLLQQGTYYRLVLSNINGGQSAEAALTVNPPLLSKNFITRHDILYPYDAPALKPGSKYAWQIQKVVNGIITNKTEAWEFVIAPNQNQGSVNFVEVVSPPNTTPYHVTGDLLFFEFNDEYNSSSPIDSVEIFNKRSEPLKAIPSKYLNPLVKQEESGKIINNRYYLNLRELGLEKGEYTLLIKNSKNQTYYLRFIL